MDIFSDSGFSFYDDTSYLAELHARVKTKSIIKLKLIISWLYFLLYYNVSSPTHMFEFWQKNHGSVKHTHCTMKQTKKKLEQCCCKKRPKIVPDQLLVWGIHIGT